MSEWRVPSNDPRSLCKSELEPSFPLVFLSGELCAVFYIRVNVVSVHFFLSMYFFVLVWGRKEISIS